MGRSIPEAVRRLTWNASDSYAKSREVVLAFEGLVAGWTIFAPRGLEYRFSSSMPDSSSYLKDAMAELSRMPIGYQKALEKLAEGVSCEILGIKGLGTGMFADVSWRLVPLRGEPRN